jgi:hypothetical protein
MSKKGFQKRSKKGSKERSKKKSPNQHTAARCNKLASSTSPYSTPPYSTSPLSKSPYSTSPYSTSPYSTSRQSASPCNEERFVSQEALKKSVEFALSNGRNISQDVKRRRHRNAVQVAKKTVDVLESAGVMQSLRRTNTAVVVLGFLPDIAGFMMMQEKGRKQGRHFMLLAVKDSDWSYALNKEFINCAVTKGFTRVHADIPIVAISTERNLLRSHTLRRKIRVTHCELAWLQLHQDVEQGKFQWQTFETSVWKNGSSVPLFVNVLRKN